MKQSVRTRGGRVPNRKMAIFLFVISTSPHPQGMNKTENYSLKDVDLRFMGRREFHTDPMELNVRRCFNQKKHHLFNFEPIAVWIIINIIDDKFFGISLYIRFTNPFIPPLLI